MLGHLAASTWAGRASAGSDVENQNPAGTPDGDQPDLSPATSAPNDSD